jgi:hypothetical protein
MNRQKVGMQCKKRALEETIIKKFKIHILFIQYLNNTCFSALEPS